MLGNTRRIPQTDKRQVRFVKSDRKEEGPLIARLVLGGELLNSGDRVVGSLVVWERVGGFHFRRHCHPGFSIVC